MANKKASLKTLAGMVNGECAGDDRIIIHGFAPVEAAVEGDITFLARAKRAGILESTSASAVIVPTEIKESGKPLIRVHNPTLAATLIHRFFIEKPFSASGVHESVIIGEECRIAERISVAPRVVIGDRVTLGEQVSIGPGAVIGDDVSVGDDTVIEANVTVKHNCIIGKRVILHPDRYWRRSEIS